MKVNATLLVLAQAYIEEHEPSQAPEALFAEFAQIRKSQENFRRFLRKKGFIKKGKMKRHISETDRRRLYIIWYVHTGNHKTLDQCVKELQRFLFVSKTTIYNTVYNYGTTKDRNNKEEALDKELINSIFNK